MSVREIRELSLITNLVRFRSSKNSANMRILLDKMQFSAERDYLNEYISIYQVIIKQ